MIVVVGGGGGEMMRLGGGVRGEMIGYSSTVIYARVHS
jgi:hypothetical protein